MNYRIDKLKVEYTVFGKNDVCKSIDKGIERLANTQGLEFWGSGFDFKTKTIVTNSTFKCCSTNTTTYYSTYYNTIYSNYTTCSICSTYHN